MPSPGTPFSPPTASAQKYPASGPASSSSTTIIPRALPKGSRCSICSATAAAIQGGAEAAPRSPDLSHSAADRETKKEVIEEKPSTPFTEVPRGAARESRQIFRPSPAQCGALNRSAANIAVVDGVFASFHHRARGPPGFGALGFPLSVADAGMAWVHASYPAPPAAAARRLADQSAPGAVSFFIVCPDRRGGGGRWQTGAPFFPFGGAFGSPPAVGWPVHVGASPPFPGAPRRCRGAGAACAPCPRFVCRALPVLPPGAAPPLFLWPLLPSLFLFVCSSPPLGPRCFFFCSSFPALALFSFCSALPLPH